MRSLANAKQAINYLQTRVPPQVVKAFGDLIDEAEQAYNTDTSNVFRASQGRISTVSPPIFTNYNTSFIAPFTIADTSTQILPSNQKRTMLVIQNLAPSSDLYFNLGSGASNINGILLTAGNGFVFDSVCPTDSVNVYFANSSVQQGVILEVRFTPT